MTDVHQYGSGFWDSNNLKACRVWGKSAKQFLSDFLETIYLKKKPWKWWIKLRLASQGWVLNENTEIKHSLLFQLDAIPLEPT